MSASDSTYLFFQREFGNEERGKLDGPIVSTTSVVRKFGPRKSTKPSRAASVPPLRSVIGTGSVAAVTGKTSTSARHSIAGGHGTTAGHLGRLPVSATAAAGRGLLSSSLTGYRPTPIFRRASIAAPPGASSITLVRSGGVPFSSSSLSSSSSLPRGATGTSSSIYRPLGQTAGHVRSVGVQKPSYPVRRSASVSAFGLYDDFNEPLPRHLLPSASVRSSSALPGKHHRAQSAAAGKGSSTLNDFFIGNKVDLRAAPLRSRRSTADYVFDSAPLKSRRSTADYVFDSVPLRSRRSTADYVFDSVPLRSRRSTADYVFDSVPLRSRRSTADYVAGSVAGDGNVVVVANRPHKRSDNDIHDKKKKLDYEAQLDLIIPVHEESLSNLRARTQVARDHLSRHRVLLDRYLPLQLGPENPVEAEVETRYGELLSRLPHLDHRQKSQKAEDEFHTVVPPYKPAAPKTQQKLLYDIANIPVKKSFTPKISDTRKRARNVLCKIHGDPHYFDF